MRKVFTLFLCLLLALSTVAHAATTAGEQAAESEAGKKFDAGAYYGSVQGTGGIMTVKVTVSDTAIETITILENRELLHRKTIVEELLIPEIIKEQSLAVDTVAAATLSSSAVIRATAAALEQANTDMDLLYEPVEEELPAAVEDDEQFDVIIVGAGIAGMFASMELYERNPDLNVLVVDKSDFVGGSLTVSGAYLLCLDNDMLRQQDKNRTPEEMADSFQTFSESYDPDYVINRDLTVNVGHAISDMWNILNKNDAPFDLGRPLTSAIGNSWYATDLMINENILTLNAGNELTRFIETLFYPTCELRLQSNVTDLIVEDGAVKGVTVDNGTQVYSAYADNVILATGGHGPNDELMEQLNPDYAGNVALGHKDSTGDGFKFVGDLGGYTMGWGLCGVMGVDFMPYSFAYPYGMLGMYATSLINLNGEIIAGREQINESPEQIAFSLWDTHSPYYSMLEDIEKLNIGYKFETTEALAADVAKRYDVNETEFDATVDQLIAESGLQAPYYAVRNAFTYYCSLPGIVVNETCQPLTATGTIIPNLYCVGELILGNFYTGAYAQVGSGLALSASSGVLAAQQITGID